MNQTHNKILYKKGYNYTLHSCDTWILPSEWEDWNFVQDFRPINNIDDTDWMPNASGGIKPLYSIDSNSYWQWDIYCDWFIQYYLKFSSRLRELILVCFYLGWPLVPLDRATRLHWEPYLFFSSIEIRLGWSTFLREIYVHPVYVWSSPLFPEYASL